MTNDFQTKYFGHVKVYSVFYYLCIVHEHWPETAGKNHGLMHYKIGVTFQYNGHKINTLL